MNTEVLRYRLGLIQHELNKLIKDLNETPVFTKEVNLESTPTKGPQTWLQEHINLNQPLGGFTPSKKGDLNQVFPSHRKPLESEIEDADKGYMTVGYGIKPDEVVNEEAHRTINKLSQEERIKRIEKLDTRYPVPNTDGYHNKLAVINDTPWDPNNEKDYRKYHHIKGAIINYLVIHGLSSMPLTIAEPDWNPDFRHKYNY